MIMIKKLFKGFLLIIVGHCILSISVPYSNYRLSKSCFKQCNYLAKELSNGLDNELQSNYPEGFVFGHALLALSLIELSEKRQEHFEDKHLLSLEYSLDHLISEEASSTFPKELTLPYGAFYNGWTAFTLKKYLDSNVSKTQPKRQNYLKKYEALTKQIFDAFAIDPMLESYHDSYWPADNLACLAALDPNEGLAIFHTWLDHLNLRPEDLIPHDLNRKEIRGSSQALSLYFLSQIAQDSLSNAMNHNYLDQLGSRHFGIDFIKEFKDKNRKMDVDSGPILFGIGSVATIMNIRTQSCANTKNRSPLTYGFMNLLGIPFSGIKRKFYLFKKEPMFDLFMLWVGVSLLD